MGQKSLSQLKSVVTIREISLFGLSNQRITTHSPAREKSASRNWPMRIGCS